ncbi:MAG: ABC transporter permease subunit [Euzebyaceae bacterium]|nr:ABC transporter permease subunit [Euzebyaceae bacterium]
MSRAVAADRPAAGRSLRHRLAAVGLDRVVLLAIPAAATIGLLFVYPFLYGLGLSFQPLDGGGVFANYRAFFNDAYQASTIAKTLRLALPAALLNVAVSVPIAHKMRRPMRFKRLITTALILPVTLGTVLVAEGLIRYFGPQGWFNQALLGLGLIDAPLRLTNNYVGVFASLVITGFPLALLIVLGHASGIDPDVEKAAATLGAGPTQRFWKVTFPLMLPGVSIAFMLAFVAAFAVFPSAVMVGNPSGETRVISIAAYQAAYEQFDYPMASTIAMVMAAVELAVIGVILGLRSRLYRGATSGGKG